MYFTMNVIFARQNFKTFKLILFTYPIQNSAIVRKCIEAEI